MILNKIKFMINVYGEKLTKCSKDGMAVTGYSRSGLCEDSLGDTGSHHICLDISKIGNGGETFCTLTEQPNWCVKPSTNCESPSQHQCNRKNWCVCQWAFSDVLSKTACENLHVDCDATSLSALRAYRQNPGKYGTALECLQHHCSYKPLAYT